MRKLINKPEDLAVELIDGFCLTNKTKVKRIAPHVCARIDAPVKGKVGIVIGGGAGHEPLFLEFIGKGMADASVHGQVFTAPTPDKVLDAIKAADSGEGVILLYNNYAGDVMNFDMGQDFARLEGHKVETVLINDEISAFPVEQAEERAVARTLHAPADIVLKAKCRTENSVVDRSEFGAPSRSLASWQDVARWGIPRHLRYLGRA